VKPNDQNEIINCMYLQELRFLLRAKISTGHITSWGHLFMTLTTKSRFLVPSFCSHVRA